MKHGLRVLPEYVDMYYAKMKIKKKKNVIGRQRCLFNYPRDDQQSRLDFHMVSRSREDLNHLLTGPSSFL